MKKLFISKQSRDNEFYLANRERITNDVNLLIIGISMFYLTIMADKIDGSDHSGR